MSVKIGGTSQPNNYWSDQLYSIFLGPEQTVFGLMLVEDDHDEFANHKVFKCFKCNIYFYFDVS